MKDKKKLKPFHSLRQNRQNLIPIYEENGIVVGSKRKLFFKNERISEKLEVLKIESDRSVDIDTVDDFIKCDSILNKRIIVFHVIGRNEIGLGHVYRALTIANELIGNDIIFVVNIKDDLAIKLIKK